MINQAKNNFEIKLSAFSGPLDVLLILIRNKKIAINDIDIIDLANQYTKFIEVCLHDVEIDILSEYLYLASQLVHLKIKGILASLNENTIDEDFELQKQELIQKLIEREKYYNSIPFLEEQFKKRQEMFDKVSEGLETYKPKKLNIEEKLPNLDSFKLKIFLESMIEDNIMDDFLKRNELFRKEIELKKISIKKMQVQLINFLNHSQFKNKALLFEVFKLIYPNHLTQEYFVCFLLAVLSLCRLQYLKLEVTDDEYFLMFDKEVLEKFNDTYLDSEDY